MTNKEFRERLAAFPDDAIIVRDDITYGYGTFDSEPILIYVELTERDEYLVSSITPKNGFTLAVSI